MTHMRSLTAAVSPSAALALSARAQPPPQPPHAQPPQQPSEIASTINGAPAAAAEVSPSRISSRCSSDAETVAAAKTIGQVLWDDLELRARVLPDPAGHLRDDSAAASIDQVPLDRWKELGADGLVVGTVRKTATGVIVQVRLIEVATGGRRWQGVQRHASTEPAAVRAHHRPTKSTSSSARCAAWRGRSWRSRRIATASG